MNLIEKGYFRIFFSPQRRRASAEERGGKQITLGESLRLLCVSAVKSLFFFCIAAFVQKTSLAQTLEIKITVLPETAKINIEGKTPNNYKDLVFIDSYANAQNLAARIENIKFYKGQSETAFNRQSAGVFATDAQVNRFTYDVRLDFPSNVAQAAHISWRTKERGLIQLGDLLPDFAEKTAAKITFELPANWKIATNENQIDKNQYQTADFENAVFLIGSFNQSTIKSGKTEINLARAGEWSFTEAETLDNAAKILAEHERIIGASPASKVQIILLPYPQNFGGERWEAETRGATLVLFSAPNVFKSRAVSQLQEQLRHELFHLWLPNALNLAGDYAWFYEGFTIYHALKTGVRLKQIRFVDFLDTMSRAFDLARRSPHNKTLSLVEASKLRWNINGIEFVYAKGMAAAFLCDLTLLGASKKSVDDIFKELYQRHRMPAVRQNANEAVLNLLKSYPELKSVVEKFIETAGEFDASAELAASGLINNGRGSFTRLVVAEKLTGRQRKLLEKLGYNPKLKGL